MPKDPRSKENVQRHAVRDMANLPPESPRPDTPKPKAPAKPKLGEEHAIGMMKLGFHELTQALPAFPDSNIRPGEEPGVFGNASMPHITPEEPTYEQSLNDYARRAPGVHKDRSQTR